MFRFTIRDVLWLTVVAALVVGWCVDRYRAAENTRALLVQQDELRANQARLEQQLSVLRSQALFAKELQGKVILTPGPATAVR